VLNAILVVQVSANFWRLASVCASWGYVSKIS
jgi:hypothetical protein